VPPVLTLTSPPSGATVSGAISIGASASAAGGVTKVDFYVTAASCSEPLPHPPTISWNSTSTSNGPRVLYAAATDTLGRVAQSGQATILVNNIDLAQLRCRW